MYNTTLANRYVCVCVYFIKILDVQFHGLFCFHVIVFLLDIHKSILLKYIINIKIYKN